VCLCHAIPSERRRAWGDDIGCGPERTTRSRIPGKAVIVARAAYPGMKVAGGQAAGH
jgi:hypothetical protein